VRSPFGRRSRPAPGPASADPPDPVDPLDRALARRFLVNDGSRRTARRWWEHCLSAGWPCVAIVGSDVILLMDTCPWMLSGPAIERFHEVTGRWLECVDGGSFRVPVLARDPAAEQVAFRLWELAMSCRPHELIPDD
jgi:hypothetical protein